MCMCTQRFTSGIFQDFSLGVELKSTWPPKDKTQSNHSSSGKAAAVITPCHAVHFLLNPSNSGLVSTKCFISDPHAASPRVKNQQNETEKHVTEAWPATGRKQKHELVHLRPAWGSDAAVSTSIHQECSNSDVRLLTVLYQNRPEHLWFLQFQFKKPQMEKRSTYFNSFTTAICLGLAGWHWNYLTLEEINLVTES